MQFAQCKCGKCTSHHSGMPPADCQGCRECNTTLEGHPDHHKPTADHTPVKKFDENTGEPYFRCGKCMDKCGENGEDLGEN